MSIVQKWQCEACKATLGIVEDGEVVHIKRKDLYVHVSGGKVTENCYQCGKPNTLEYKEKKFNKF